MKKNVVSVMVSADWHIGATDPNRFENELLNLVSEELDKKKSLDLFVIAGDVFDMKEYLSSDAVKSFFIIMAKLLSLTEPFNTEFRIIEGTRTHDALQLSTLSIIFDKLAKIKRVKFIETVTEESLLGMDILYIPEEYVIDDELYYKDFFSKKYDFIFGHGNTDLMWYMKGVEQNKLSQAPVFKVEELCNIARYSYFGHFHYHIASGPDNRFKSIGPVTRWEFGKEGECGLYSTQYDISSKLAIEEYIENEYAPILPTVIMNIKKEYELDELNKLVKQKITEPMKSSDKVRLIVNIDTTIKNFNVMRDFVLGAYGKVDRLTLILKLIGSTEENIKEESEETIEKSIEEKPYLYDKSMHDEARIAAFIRKKEGVNISLESILEIIQKKDTKIKARED